jgi:hypothetical protein
MHHVLAIMAMFVGASLGAAAPNVGASLAVTPDVGATSSDVPKICTDALSRNDASNPFTYVESNAICAETGDCKQSCVSFVKASICNFDFNDDDKFNLLVAVTNQSFKDGLTQTTESGPWFCAWDLGTTALPNQDILYEWGEAITTYYGSGKSERPSTVYFEQEGTNGRFYGINCIYDCFYDGRKS